jgi:hypothetical protein
MKIFSLKPLTLHLLYILFGYTTLLIPSIITYNNIHNSLNSYEEFITFEKEIFQELIDFQSNLLKKDDIDHLLNSYSNNKKRSFKLEYLENTQKIFKTYIKEINNFDNDNLDEDLIKLNIELQQINNYINKMIISPNSFKNININKKINNILFLIYTKNKNLNYNNFKQYSYINLEYHTEINIYLENFKYMFFILIILFILSLSNWNKRRILGELNNKLIIKYKMVFNECINPTLLLNNNGDILEINDKLRRKIGAPKYHFINKKYTELFADSNLDPLMNYIVDKNDISYFENFNKCEILTYSNNNKLSAEFFITTIYFESEYWYIINFKNIK